MAIDLAGSGLTPEVAGSIETLIYIIKAIGLAFVIYLVFMIFASILNIIRSLRIKKIQQKVEEIDKKLDKLIEEKNKKRK